MEATVINIGPLSDLVLCHKRKCLHPHLHVEPNKQSPFSVVHRLWQSETVGAPSGVSTDFDHS